MQSAGAAAFADFFLSGFPVRSGGVSIAVSSVQAMDSGSSVDNLITAGEAA